MSVSIDYDKQDNKEDAYTAVKNAINPELLKKFQVKAELIYEQNSIKAKGSGFELDLYFQESSCDLSLKLSLMLKPFKNKIISTLEREVKKVV